MGLVCYSLTAMDVDYCLAWTLADIGPHAVELRLDDLLFDRDDVRYFMQNKGDCPVVAAYRFKDPALAEEYDDREGDGSDAPDPSDVDMAVRMLSAAIMSGVEYVDLDLDFPAAEQRWLLQLAMNYGCKIIISYFNPHGTGSTEDLAAIANRCYARGADIAKVVTFARHRGESQRVLALYDRFEADKLIAYAMGDEGEESRYEAFRRGMPLLYAAPRRSGATSKGQPLFFDFRDPQRNNCWGDVEPPTAQNLTIIAIVAASLARGVTVLENVSLSEDIRAAMDVARMFMATVKYDKKERTLTITGRQDFPKKKLKTRVCQIFVGRCELLYRLVVPLLTYAKEMVLWVEGDGALAERPESDNHPEIVRHGGWLHVHKKQMPMTVGGTLQPGTYNFTVPSNSYFAPGLLMVLPAMESFSDSPVTFNAKEPESLCLLRQVNCILSRMGIKIEERSCDDNRSTFTFSQRQSYKPCRMEMDGDWAAAALWLTLGTVAGESGVDHMRENTLQSESFILDVLETAGADVERYTDPEMEHLGDTIGYYSAFRSLPVAMDTDITTCPDLLGPLILLALRSEGVSKIRGVKACGEAARQFVLEFTKLGAKISLDDGVITVEGSCGNTLHAAKLDCHGNPRLALALSVAAQMSDGDLDILGLDAFERIWPDFPLL